MKPAPSVPAYLAYNVAGRRWVSGKLRRLCELFGVFARRVYSEHER